MVSDILNGSKQQKMRSLFFLRQNMILAKHKTTEATNSWSCFGELDADLETS